MNRRIACALLAAGASRRLGQPKQLVSTQGGEPLVRAIAREVCASACSERAVVLGAHATEVEAALAGLALTPLANLAWEEGVAASLRVAAHWAEARKADVLVVCVCDQPALTASHLDALAAAVRDADEAAASAYRETLGVPAAFGCGWYESLLALRGDRGAGSLLRTSASVRSVAWPEGAFDIDSEADLAIFRAAQSAGKR